MAADTPAPNANQRFSLELQLLCACARQTLRPVDAERIADLCREPLDWEFFFRLLTRHRIDPLVWRSLEGVAAEWIPEEVQAALRRRIEKNSLDALQQTAELARLVRRFDRAGIRLLPLKGPVLAQQIYEKPRLRHAGHDLDLLIERDSLGQADQLLKGAGYSRTDPDYTLSPGQAAAYMKVNKDFSYRHNESTVQVELHWRWSQNARLFPLTLDDLWGSLESVRMGSQSVPAMPKQELLLYLCAHGAHTGWFRLKWLCDVAELLSSDQRIEMKSLLARAEQLGLTRMLAQALILANQVLGARLPSELDPRMRRDRIVQSLVEMGMRALVLDDRYWSTDDTPLSWMPTQLRYRLRLRGDLRYKWHNAYFYSLWTEDCARIRLPKRLYPLYYLVAPMLWSISMLKKGLSSKPGH